MKKKYPQITYLLIQIDFSNVYKLETSCELKYIVLNISYVLLYFDAWYNKTKEKKNTTTGICRFLKPNMYF